MKEYLDLFLTFARIGGLTFGGGYAMLPMLQQEVVDRRGWATNEELMDYYAIGQCTPGVIAVNTATFVGNKTKGTLGGIFATLGVVFPSLVIITIIAAFIRNFAELETLIARINHTNNAAMVDGMSLTDLLAKRDCLKQRVSIMRTFLDNASAPVSRYSLKEIMVYSTVDVEELQRSVDKIAKELREVDEKIQGANWTIDLI